MKQFLLLTILAIATYSVSADVCSGQADGLHFPHPDCGKFYVCDKNVGVVKECVAGLHFSPTKKYCVKPDEAGCIPGPDPTPDPGPDPTPDPGPDPTPDPGPDPTPDPGPGPGPAGECKGQPLGKRIPYPKVCEKFIVCIGGGVVQDCPPPLHFNADLEVCDWPERANCPWR